MKRSEATVPWWDGGALNKHGPPVSRPPNCWLHIRGKPRTRDPVRRNAPARNKAPAPDQQLILEIRPPSLQWESSARPPTASRKGRLVVRGNNYWDHDRPPDNCVWPQSPPDSVLRTPRGEYARKVSRQ